ncbi:MAG: glycyl-radical enzyme activating protein [Deltaproteobacteria bacterium]|nr:glycyl-radical enzyme activating protein [Deltaproteobacteria bacterium]
MKPLVLEIKGNSLDDGPGIRSVVFFKGCPLDCKWCHNPESKRAQVEISYDSKVCIGCKTCITTCPNKAIAETNPFFIDRDACDLCFACVETCPSGALTRVGMEMSHDEILDRVIVDKPFFDTSHGGVTLSGGEPAFNMKFAGQTARKLKKNNIHVLLETCGLFDINRFYKHIYPYIDMIYFDIKLMDTDAHKKYCGADNSIILKNFSALQKKYANGGVPVLARTPLIPGITDTDGNLRAIGSWLASRDVQKIQIMAYHPMWIEKNAKIGMKLPISGNLVLSEWMSRESVERCKNILASEGLEVVV